MEELGAILETGGVAAVELAASAMAERGEPVGPCPSCGKPMIGPFCAICGQPRDTHRRSVRHLLHEFVKDIASFDSRILRTTRALLFRPGELPIAFREGRTQPYVPAVRLYLFVSLAFFLFLSATGLAFLQLGLQVWSVKYDHDAAGHVIKIANGVRSVVPGLHSDAHGNITVDMAGVALPDAKADGETTTNTITTKAEFFRPFGKADVKLPADIRQELEQARGAVENGKEGNWFTRGVYRTVAKLQTDPAALNGPLTEWIPRILFVLLPAFAFLLAMFYRKLRRDYLFVDHLVFSLTIHSFAFVVLIGAASAAQILPDFWLVTATLLVLSVYFVLSLKRFYRQGWGKTVLKFACIAIIYPIFFLGPALTLALIASMVEG